MGGCVEGEVGCEEAVDCDVFRECLADGLGDCVRGAEGGYGDWEDSISSLVYYPLENVRECEIVKLERWTSRLGILKFGNSDVRVRYC